MSDNIKYQDFICPICKMIMHNVVSVCCGHNFCFYCIYNYIITREQDCPVCKKCTIRDDSIAINITLNNILLATVPEEIRNENDRETEIEELRIIYNNKQREYNYIKSRRWSVVQWIIRQMTFLPFIKFNELEYLVDYINNILEIADNDILSPNIEPIIINTHDRRHPRIQKIYLCELQYYFARIYFDANYTSSCSIAYFSGDIFYKRIEGRCIEDISECLAISPDIINTILLLRSGYNSRTMRCIETDQNIFPFRNGELIPNNLQYYKQQVIDAEFDMDPPFMKLYWYDAQSHYRDVFYKYIMILKR